MNYVRVSWPRGPCFLVGVDIDPATTPVIIAERGFRVWFAPIEDEV